MNFKAAERKMRAGYAMRHPGMGPGWCVIYGKPGPDFWWVNPITGTQVGFGFKDDERAREDWAQLNRDGGP